MITGLRGATIWSEDLNNLLPFYRDVVGLPGTVETPGFVVLGQRVAPALALGTHSEVRGRNSDPAGTAASRVTSRPCYSSSTSSGPCSSSWPLASR